MTTNILDWLRAACAEYQCEPLAIYRANGTHKWPLTAANEEELRRKLEEGGHFLPLPKEPAALANVIEVSVVDFLLARIAKMPGAVGHRGTERGYPDIEIGGFPSPDQFHAVDVKVARRASSGRMTDSRITLYTGNTYFQYDTLKWPGMFRPFAEYVDHLDIIVLYTLNEQSDSRIEDLEILVHQAWRIASRKRSSTTREYIGAVNNIEALRQGRGEFATAEEFYRFWRKYPFKVGKVVQQQLHRLLRDQKP